MAQMKFFLTLYLTFLPMLLIAQTHDSIIGRPYKSFDLSAFCSYNNYHPSEYLTDNNWDILCAFAQPGTTAKLDSLGIKYNKSQLRLLEVGDLLTYNNDRNNNDTIDLLCKAITTNLSNAVKMHCVSWSKTHNIASLKLGQIIFYHEVMWDLLDILESKGIIAMPAILKGEEVGKEHFGEICFIVIDSTE